MAGSGPRQGGRDLVRGTGCGVCWKGGSARWWGNLSENLGDETRCDGLVLVRVWVWGSHWLLSVVLMAGRLREFDTIGTCGIGTCGMGIW